MSIVPLLTANTRTYFAIPYRTLTQQLTLAPMLLLVHPENGLSAEFPSAEFESRVSMYNAKMDWNILFNRIFETLKNWLGEEASKRLANSEVEIRKVIDQVCTYLAGTRPMVNEIAGFILVRGYHFTYVTYQGGLIAGTGTRVTIKPLEDKSAFLASAIRIPISTFLQDLQYLHDTYGSIDVKVIEDGKTLKNLVKVSRNDFHELVNYICHMCEITPYGYATFVIFTNSDYSRTVFADVRRVVEYPDITKIRKVVAYSTGSTAIIVIELDDFDPSEIKLIPKDLIDKIIRGESPRLTALKRLVAYKVFGKVRTRLQAEQIREKVTDYLQEEEEERPKTETEARLEKKPETETETEKEEGEEEEKVEKSTSSTVPTGRVGKYTIT